MSMSDYDSFNPSPTESIQKKEYRHNWLYSVLPGKSERLFLTGYCKVCDYAFSAEIPTEYETFPAGVTLMKMDIPKFGCVEQTLP